MWRVAPAMWRVRLLRSVEPHMAARRHTMATAKKMMDPEHEVNGYGYYPGPISHPDLNTILGDETLQDPYILPATQANGDMKAVGKDLRENGVVAIKGAIAPSAVAAFAAEHLKLLNLVAQELRSDKMMARGTNFYKAYSQMEGGLQLRSNVRGRFELSPICRRDGGTEVTEKTRIAELVEPLICPPAVAEVLDYAMDTPWRMSLIGSLPTEPNAPCGNWHRDQGAGLFGDEDFELSLPDYFFTALLPLEGSLTWENGSEFVLGSHRIDSASVGSARRAVGAGEPGDVILLNGKTVHRGLPNVLSTPRPMIFVTYSAHWYQQGRDESCEYWKSEGLKQ